MSISLTQAQQKIYQSAKSYAQEYFAPNAAQWELDGRLSAEAFENIRRHGYFGVISPPELGGKGYSYLETALAYEGLAYGDAAATFLIQLHNNIVFELATFYPISDRIKALLPDLVTGKKQTSFALSEDCAGCDPMMGKAYAELRADGYHVFGEKTWVSNMADAQYFTVMVRDGSPRGMVMLLMDRDMPGFEVQEDRRRIAGNAMSCGNIAFNDVVVPTDYLLSEHGYKEALKAIDIAKVFVPAIAVGMAQKAIDLATDFLAARETFGAPILKNQAIQFQLAELVAKLEAARWLVYHTASIKDSGERVATVAAMSKLSVPNTVMEISVACSQFFGALGCEYGSEISRIMNMAKIFKVVDGSTEMQHLVLGREIERAAFPKKQ